MALDISGDFEETEISNVYGNTVVRRRYEDGRDWDLKNKPKDFFNKSEADMMQFASCMDTKAPQVRGCIDNPQDNEFIFMVSDFVPGDTLLDVWPRMDESQRASIKAQLKEQLALMRKCQMPYTGRVDRRAFRNVFDPIKFSFAGPFMSEGEFDTWCLSQIEGIAERWRWKASLMLRGREYSKDFVLTHGDLFPQNIIVHDGKLMGIVDWENSGFFPEYFEYGVVMSQYGYEGQECGRASLRKYYRRVRKRDWDLRLHYEEPVGWYRSEDTT